MEVFDEGDEAEEAEESVCGFACPFEDGGGGSLVVGFLSQVGELEGWGRVVVDEAAVVGIGPGGVVLAEFAQ